MNKIIHKICGKLVDNCNFKAFEGVFLWKTFFAIISAAQYKVLSQFGGGVRPSLIKTVRSVILYVQNNQEHIFRMTINELKKNWATVLDSCHPDKMDAVKLEQWYRPLTPVRIDEDSETIYFVCRDLNNQLVRNMIKSNYSVVRESIIEVFGKPYKLELSEEENVADIPESEDIRFVDEHYTFESFVSGSNNRLALACSLAIAERFTPEYNPLFIYGGSGLGKTHLLAAIAHYVNKNNPEKKVLYVTTEAFTNELVKAIRENATSAFHDKYRQLDILLLDDIQFIADKERTQEEVFNTFNALHSANKQVVLSSDRPPKELKGLPDRLISRFSQGMTADIQPPDYETRVAILQQKLEERGYDIDKDLADVIDLIAQNITDNIRELEGALTRVIAMANLADKPITKEFARSVLSDIFTMNDRDLTPGNIKKIVAEFFGLKVSDLEGSKRSRDIVYPRQIAIFLIRKHTDMSLPQIGKEFGDRDHTTIMHSCDKIEEELKTNDSLKDRIERIESQLIH